MEMGAKFPEWFISKVRTSSAELPLKEKSPVMASCRKGLKFDVAAVNARRLFGSRGSGGRQDVLITEEAIEPLASDGGPRCARGVQEGAEKRRGKEKEGRCSQTWQGQCDRGRADIAWPQPSYGPAWAAKPARY